MTEVLQQPIDINRRGAARCAELSRDSHVTSYDTHRRTHTHTHTQHPPFPPPPHTPPHHLTDFHFTPDFTPSHVWSRGPCATIICHVARLIFSISTMWTQTPSIRLRLQTKLSLNYSSSKIKFSSWQGCKKTDRSPTSLEKSCSPQSRSANGQKSKGRVLGIIGLRLAFW